MSSDYTNTILYRVLNESPPPLKRIARTLREIDAADVGELLRNEPETLYLIDYYFRLFDSSIGGRLINDPALGDSVLIELFTCQVIRYYRANLESESYDPEYASLMHSYWRQLEPGRLVQLFRLLLTAGESNRYAVLLLLQGLDITDLRDLPPESSRKVIAFMESIDMDFESLIARNLDLYDFLYRKAQELSDGQFLGFLDRYTNFVVQLRIAQSLASEAEGSVDGTGKLAFKEVVRLVESVPADVLEVLLGLLERRGLVDSGTIASIRAMRESDQA